MKWDGREKERERAGHRAERRDARRRHYKLTWLIDGARGEATLGKLFLDIVHSVLQDNLKLAFK